MKNVIITGTCRAGKTMLALKLKELVPTLNYISIDVIRKSLKNLYNKDYQNEYLNELQDFIYDIFNAYKLYNYGNLILEGVNLSIQEILKNYNNPDNIIVFVGRPQLPAEENFIQIRKSEKIIHSWTEHHSDEYISEMVKKWLKIDKANLEICKKYGFQYLDTSYCRAEVIDDFAKKLVLQILEEHYD